MRTVSAQWASTLTQSHRRWVRVSSYLGGVKTGEPPIVDGSVSFDASTPGARRCSIAVPLVDSSGTSWSPGTNREAPLASNGQRLLIESGIYHPNGTLEFVSLGWYLISDSVVDESTGTLAVTGIDLWSLIDTVPILSNAVSMRIPADRLSAIRANTAVDALLYPRLMSQPFPGSSTWPVETKILNQAATFPVLPPVVGGPSHAITTIQGDSRAQAILNVFQYWGVTPRVDDAGNLRAYRVAIPPTASDTPVVTLTDANGTNPVLVNRAYQSLREKVYNAVIVTAKSSTSGQTLFVGNLQYNSGPLSTQGPMGYRPKFMDTNFATTQAETDAIASNELARSVMYALTQTLTTVPNAAIELDDVVLVDTAASGTFKGRVTRIDMPLLSTGPMTLTVSNQTAVTAFAAIGPTATEL